jgi:hypothetical protein
MSGLGVALDVDLHYNYRYPVVELAFQGLYAGDKSMSVVAGHLESLN